MPRGTLYDHLHKVTATPLSWIQRLKIAIGAGRGLDYLHTGFGTHHGVIHRDVKSSNILLDENWAAMISDFGLSKIGPTDHASNNISVSVKGTFGYLDPEYYYTSKLTPKTDVYAFGVVLFELLSGKLAVDTSLKEEQGSLARWGQKCVKERKYDQMVDSNIRGTFAPKCLRGFAEIANRCLIRDFEKRPSMTQVVAKLQDLLELQEKYDNSADSLGTSGFTWIFYKYRASETNQNSAIDIKKFTYDELKMATRNFNNDTCLVVGSYVKGWINKNNYSPCMDDTGLPIWSMVQLKSDVKKLKEFRHPNLVKVIGYCKGEMNLLVSEFVHNENFENLLSSGTIGLLPLATKVKVAIGIARGIVHLCDILRHDDVGLYSYLPEYSKIWDWNDMFTTFEFDKYKILLDEDFTAKLLERDITKLVKERDHGYDHLMYDKYGLVDGDWLPGICPPEVKFAMIFSGFRSVFTEVLTGRKFSTEEFYEINHSWRKNSSLGVLAELCFLNCNTIDSEQMMLKYIEKYENHIHMGSRHL